MVASDNTRDPFYAYGDLDMLEVYRAATRLLHFDHDGPEWIRTVSATPADLMGLDRHGRIEAGDAADLVLLRARSLTEWLARPYRPHRPGRRPGDRHHAAGLPGTGSMGEAVRAIPGRNRKPPETVGRDA